MTARMRRCGSTNLRWVRPHLIQLSTPPPTLYVTASIPRGRHSRGLGLANIASLHCRKTHALSVLSSIAIFLTDLNYCPLQRAASRAAITIWPPVQMTSRSTIGQFSSMPTELIIKVFCHLPTLFDTFALSESFHWLRDIWAANFMEIYRLVGLRCIPCERRARIFLAVQGGPAIESPMLSIEDIIRIVKNARVVEDALLQFKRLIVFGVKCMFYIIIPR